MQLKNIILVTQKMQRLFLYGIMMKLNQAVIVIYFLLSVSVPAALAAEKIDANNDYFQALQQIKKIPSGAVPILACDTALKKARA